jgi:putative phage-type endonuclease
MNRQTFTPESEAGWHALRAVDLTSTDAAALFGLSPYKTPFELWHEKKVGAAVEIDQNDRMLWGTRLQDAIAAGIAEDQGLVIRPMREYVRLTGMRLGSSFDHAIVDVLPSSPFRETFIKRGPGILEIKNVDWLAFRNGWLVEADYIEAPAHIEIQTQHQQLVSGWGWSIIGALVGGNRYEALERLADVDVHAGIVAKAAEFWHSIDTNTPPPPVMPDDAAAVIRMHGFAEPGKLYDAKALGDDEIAGMLADYVRLGREAKDIEEIREVRKAELLQRIGDAEKVLVDGFSVTAGMVGPTTVSYERKGYRNFRVTAKKPSTKAAAE